MSGGRLTNDATAILRAAIAAADPAPAVAAAVSALDLRDADVVHVIAVGKAALPMMDAALRTLPRPPASCLAVTTRAPGMHSREYAVMTAAHPVPDTDSLHAGLRIASVLGNARPADRIVLLVSGGASALAILPVDGVSLEDYAALVSTLLERGADIVQLNTVRRHIDLLKGGGMTRLTSAVIDGLIVSDVIGNRLDMIASGPLTTSASTPSHALDVLDALGIDAPAVRRALARARVPGDAPHAARVRVVLDNTAAVAGAAAHAASLGYETHVLERSISGEARHAAAAFTDRLESLAAAANAPICLLAGGETTVTVRGRGTGGRNQEFTLAAALRLPPDRAVGSIGTDGIDGMTNAAGAVADAHTIARLRSSGYDPQRSLDDNDSHTILRAAGALITTGPTGTNVMDVMVGLAFPS